MLIEIALRQDQIDLLSVGMIVDLKDTAIVRVTGLDDPETHVRFTNLTIFERVNNENSVPSRVPP